MSSQCQNPNFQNIEQEDNNNTALIRMVKERRRKEETDQGDDHTTAVSEQTNGDLITILKSANFKEALPLAETFIVSRVSDVRCYT